MWSDEDTRQAYTEAAKEIEHLYFAQLSHARKLGEIAKEDDHYLCPFRSVVLREQWHLGRNQ